MGCDFGAFVAVGGVSGGGREVVVGGIADLFRTRAVIWRSGYVFAMAYRASPPMYPVAPVLRRVRWALVW